MRNLLASKQELILVTALGLDLSLGDPPNKFHPVAWIGRAISHCLRFIPRGKPMVELVVGGCLQVGGTISIVAFIHLLSHIIRELPRPLDWLMEAALLKTTFSIRGLDRAAKDVENALESDDLNSARQSLSDNLVSRDTKTLNSSQVAAGAIESVAENTSDGIIAPLLFYILGGLPLAFGYRFANTMDSMIGYHTQMYEWLGKIPARVDDILNFMPARLTAVSFTLASFITRSDAKAAWQIVLRDAQLTESPNAGYPMSAMASALEIELEKSGCYRLGAGKRKPTSYDITRARHLMFQATILATFFLFWLPNRKHLAQSRNSNK